MKKLIIFILLISTGSIFAQTATDYYNQAKTKYDKGEYKKGLKTVDKALKLEATNFDCLFLKIRLLFANKEYKQSIELLNNALIDYPQKSILYSFRASINIIALNYDKAIQDYNIAINLSEHDSLKNNYTILRGVTKSFNKDLKAAYLDFQMAYAYDSTNLIVLQNLGFISDKIGKDEEKFKFLFKAIEVDSTDYGTYGNIGYKYLTMGEYQKAIEYLDKSLRFNPKFDLAYSNRSFCKLKLGDIDGAMIDVEKAIKLNPNNSWAYKNRALIYIELKMLDKACKDLDKAIAKGYTTNWGDEVKKLQQKYCK